MSYLLSDVITRVQHKLDDASFDTAKLIDFANDTEREIFNRYRINNKEVQLDTITTTAGSRDLTGLPTTALQYITLRIILPVNYSKVIPYVEYEDADVFYPNYNLLGQGPPIAWFNFAGVPALLNRADKTYTLSAKYTAQPTTLTVVGDTPNIPQEHSEILVLGMYARALEFNDEFDKAQVARQQMHQLAVDYVDTTRRTAGTPHIMKNNRTMNRNILQR